MKKVHQLQWRTATTAMAYCNHCSGCYQPLQWLGNATANDGERHCRWWRLEIELLKSVVSFLQSVVGFLKVDAV